MSLSLELLYKNPVGRRTALVNLLDARFLLVVTGREHLCVQRTLRAVVANSERDGLSRRQALIG